MHNPTREAIAALHGMIDTDVAVKVWETALQAPEWDHDPVWFHGDLLCGNLLVKEGTLRAVIDFGALGVGDPACDLMAAWAGERLARRFGIPFLLEIRDLWPETLVSLGSVSRRHPLVWWMSQLEWRLYRRADQVLSLLPGAAQYIAEHGGTVEKTVWLPNGIDLEWIPDPKPLEDRDIFTAMFAGAHGAANGLDDVLSAAEVLQKASDDPVAGRIRFKLVGDGREKTRLMKRAQELGLNNVEFAPPVPKHQVYATLQEADAFLMVLENSPVFRWGISPNKLWDYLACARPVIFSVSTPFNPIEDARAGVTATPGDPRSLAGAIRQLAALPLSERQAMGRRGRLHVEQHHSFVSLASQLEDVMNQLTAKTAFSKLEPLRRAA